MNFPEGLPPEFWYIKEQLNNKGFTISDNSDSEFKIYENSYLFLFVPPVEGEYATRMPVVCIINTRGVIPEMITADQQAVLRILKSYYPDYSPDNVPDSKISNITLSYFPGESVVNIWGSITDMITGLRDVLKDHKELGLDNYQDIYSIVFVPQLNTASGAIEDSLKKFVDMFVKGISKVVQTVEYKETPDEVAHDQIDHALQDIFGA